MHLAYVSSVSDPMSLLYTWPHDARKTISLSLKENPPGERRQKRHQTSVSLWAEDERREKAEDVYGDEDVRQEGITYRGGWKDFLGGWGVEASSSCTICCSSVRTREKSPSGLDTHSPAQTERSGRGPGLDYLAPWGLWIMGRAKLDTTGR